MSQEIIASIKTIVVGQISPYEFVDEKTGEAKAGINIRTTGRIVGLFGLDPKIVENMNEGDWWEIHGEPDASSSKGTVKLAIKRPTYLKFLRKGDQGEGPSVDFGDSVKSSKQPAAAKS